MACANCDVLREQVFRLERELGIRLRAGEIGAVVEALDVTPTQARMLLRLYHATGLWIASKTFVDESMAGGLESVRSQISSIRERVGKEMIESSPGRGSLGYKLTVPGASMMLAAVQPIEMQDTRGLTEAEPERQE